MIVLKKGFTVWMYDRSDGNYTISITTRAIKDIEFDESELIYLKDASRKNDSAYKYIFNKPVKFYHFIDKKYYDIKAYAFWKNNLGMSS